MEKIVEYVNEGKRQAENSQKIMAIQSNIDGGEVPTISPPTRRTSLLTVVRHACFFFLSFFLPPIQFLGLVQPTRRLLLESTFEVRVPKSKTKVPISQLLSFTFCFITIWW